MEIKRQQRSSRLTACEREQDIAGQVKKSKIVNNKNEKWRENPSEKSG